MIGGTGINRSKHAWLEVYRSLSHGVAKAACRDRSVIARFPQSVVSFAEKFAEMQEKRHEADYNPYARFYKSSVIGDIEAIASIIASFEASPVKDRRAFASWVLFRGARRG